MPLELTCEIFDNEYSAEEYLRKMLGPHHEGQSTSARKKDEALRWITRSAGLLRA
jgi:hypothetical protein